MAGWPDWPCGLTRQMTRKFGPLAAPGQSRWKAGLVRLKGHWTHTAVDRDWQRSENKLDGFIIETKIHFIN